MRQHTSATVFVVDDEEPIRRLVQLLMQDTGMAVEGYEAAETFLDSYQSDRAGCLVTDLRLPGMSGLELQQTLAKANSPLPVILLTGHADVQTAVKALRSNVVDFVEKPFADVDLKERIQRAVELDMERRQVCRWQSEVRQRMASLSGREEQVLELVVQGLASKQIAHRLEIAEKTVEAHRTRIMSKLGARNLADLVRLAVSADPTRAAWGAQNSVEPSSNPDLPAQL